MTSLSIFLLLIYTAAPLTPLPKLLGLDEALQMGRTRQPQVRMAMAQADAARARSHQARAPLLPQLTGTAQYQRTTANFVLRPGAFPAGTTSNVKTSLSNTSYNFFVLQATANQLVYNFNTSIDKYRAAEASVAAQDQNTLTMRLGVDYNVRNAYFAAHAAHALVQVAQETLENMDKHLKQIEGYIAVGTRAEIDLAQARNDVANARVTLIQAQNTYETSKVRLNQAMGVEAAVDYDVTPQSLEPLLHEEAEDDSLVDEALENRPEFAQLRENVRAQELTLSSYRGTYGPSLGVQANVTDQGIDPRALSWNWNALATLTWPIFAGGLNQGQIEEAQATLSGLLASQDSLRQQVRLDVEQARLDVRANKQVLEAAGESLFNARERLKYAEGRYETGVGSIIELGDAQVAVTSAAAQQVQANYQLAAARAALMRAVARL